MKKTIVGILMVTPLLGFSMQPPEYLSVPEFKKCLASQKIDTMEQWCLPENKPQGCPEESWGKLSNMDLLKCSTPNQANNY
jgi:hypothetical protein